MLKRITILLGLLFPFPLICLAANTNWKSKAITSGLEVQKARRKGDTWYVAGINGKDESQVITVDWSAWKKAKGKTLIFEDGKQQQSWKITTSSVKKLPRQITLQPRGDFVLVLNKNKYNNN